MGIQNEEEREMNAEGEMQEGREARKDKEAAFKGKDAVMVVELWCDWVVAWWWWCRGVLVLAWR